MTLKPCIGCGEPTGSTRCPSCQPAHERTRGSAHARGYDKRWSRLSQRARRMQPWCTDCGTVENLTTDHLPSAWHRKAQGLVIRLSDVAVVCGPCNTARGSSRPGTERAQTHGPGGSTAPSGTGREAKFQSQTARHSRKAHVGVFDPLRVRGGAGRRVVLLDASPRAGGECEPLASAIADDEVPGRVERKGGAFPVFDRGVRGWKVDAEASHSWSLP